MSVALRRAKTEFVLIHFKPVAWLNGVILGEHTTAFPNTSYTTDSESQGVMLWKHAFTQRPGETLNPSHDQDTERLPTQYAWAISNLLERTLTLEARP